MSTSDSHYPYKPLQHSLLLIEQIGVRPCARTLIKKNTGQLSHPSQHASHSQALRRRTATHKAADHLRWLREQALQSIHAAAASSSRPARETCPCCGRQSDPPFISQLSAFSGSKSTRVQTLVPRELRTDTCERMCRTIVNTIPLALPAPILPHKQLKCRIQLAHLIHAIAARWRRYPLKYRLNIEFLCQQPNCILHLHSYVARESSSLQSKSTTELMHHISSFLQQFTNIIFTLRGSVNRIRSKTSMQASDFLASAQKLIAYPFFSYFKVTLSNNTEQATRSHAYKR